MTLEGTSVTDEYAETSIPACGTMHIRRLMVTQEACCLTSTLRKLLYLLKLTLETWCLSE